MTREEAIASEGLEKRYERYKGIIKNLTIMNDIFMRNVFKKRECTEYVLQVIMGKKDLRIIDQVLQKDYKKSRECMKGVSLTGKWEGLAYSASSSHFS